MHETSRPNVALPRLLIETGCHTVDGPIDVEPVGIGFGSFSQSSLDICPEVLAMHAGADGVNHHKVDLVEAREERPSKRRIELEGAHQNGTSFSQILLTSAHTVT